MFQVGDKVRAFGLDGVVKSIEADDSYSVEVKFENDKYTCFTMEGKDCDWHKESSLVLIERPKKLVKVYQYAYKSNLTGRWVISSTLFRDDADFSRLCAEGNKFKCLDHTMIEVEE